VKRVPYLRAFWGLLRFTMSKIDDMRKMREKQFADAQKTVEPKARNGVSPAVVALPIPPINAPGNSKGVVDAPEKIEVIDLEPPKERTTTTSSSRGKRDEVTEARCSVCGKVKAVQNGLIATHQKGLGKICTGSRKEPA